MVDHLHGSSGPKGLGAYSIGASFPRRDAIDKVTGKEKYAADYYGEDMLWCGAKRSSIGHGKLININIDPALELEGVLRVLTHQDILGTNRQGVVEKDQPVLVDSYVRHQGDPLALVLAEDRETLKKALDLIEVVFKEIPGVFDPEEALDPASVLVHKGRSVGNLLLSGEHITGKGKEAFSECHVVAHGCFKTARQEHAYLETESGWAVVDEDGRLTIICSTQTPFRDRSEVAEALGIEPEKIRVIAPYPGGAFGGKDGVTTQTLLGLAALNSGGRPVKMWWDREESFMAGTKRHPAKMTYKLGAKEDGALHCLEVDLILDTGPYDHLGGVVLALGLEHAGGPYGIPNLHVKGSAVYTNNPIGGAFRGFGVTQVTMAMEQMMDILAEKLNMDPLELRLKNAVQRGDKISSGKTLVNSTGIAQCLRTIEKHRLWQKRQEWKAGAEPFKKRGVGIAALVHGAGYGPIVPDVANAKIELTLEGKIRVYSGVVDMGQGNGSTNLQIAGAILCQSDTFMELVLPDTDKTLPSGSASASRCTYTFGNALIIASEKLKAGILERAADLLMAENPSDLAIAPGLVRHLPSGKEIPLSKMALYMNESERVAVARFRAPVAAERFDVGPGLNLHGFPHTLFSFGACLALVEVDELTGEVTVCNYLSSTDCGKIINPEIYEQQIHGAIAQGIGYALTEDLKVEQGVICTKNFETYIIPTSMDIPDIESIPVEIYEETGPYGLKGLGEIAINGPAGAIANAIHDACGVRTMETPMKAESLLLAMRKRNKSG